MSDQQKPSFEQLLRDPHEQFDGQSELRTAILASIQEYADAPPATFTLTARHALSGWGVEASMQLAELEHRLRERAEAYGANADTYLEAARKRARETGIELAPALRAAILQMGDDWAAGKLL